MSPREQHNDLYELACDHFTLSQQAWARGDIEAFKHHCEEHSRIAKAAHAIFMVVMDDQ